MQFKSNFSSRYLYGDYEIGNFKQKGKLSLMRMGNISLKNLIKEK
jgi:hypothetical protein